MFSIVFPLYRLFRAGDHRTIVDESEGDYWNPNNDGHLRAKMPEKPRRLKTLGGRYRLFRAGDHRTIVDESEGDYWNPNNDGHLRAKMPEKPRRLKTLGGRP